jgi:hypothetical protein
VQKVFENNLSLERRICAKCEKESRTCRSPEDSEIIHRRGGDRWQKIERFGRKNFGRFLRENKDLHEVAKRDFNPDHWIWKGTWQRSMHFRGRTLQRKVEERIPEELGKPK